MSRTAFYAAVNLVRRVPPAPIFAALNPTLYISMWVTCTSVWTRRRHHEFLET